MATRKKPQTEPQETEKAAEQPTQTISFEIGQTVTNHDGDWIVTRAGLPNTCMISGEAVTDGYWLARSADHGRAGQGISAAAFIEMQPGD